MNKEDAAKVLGVSTKTVVNYSNLGLLEVEYIKGKTRPVADYDANAVHELKTKIDAGEVQIGKRESGNMETGIKKAENVETSIVPVSRNPIIKQGNGNRESGTVSLSGEDLAFLINQSAKFQMAEQGTKMQELAVKTLLTFAEAAQFTGLSERSLRVDAKTGKLKAVRQGKADRILRENLDKYLKEIHK